MILSRKPGEKIIIALPDGQEIVMQVVQFRGNAVRLGWVADKAIRIDREERCTEGGGD